MDGRTLSGEVESNAGGVGRNLADCMTRLELNPFFISVVGALEHSHALLSKMEHMMPYSCCVPNCRGNYDGNNKASVFKFPQDPLLKEKWVRSIPRKDLNVTNSSRDTRGVKLSPNSRTAVCIVVLDQYGECLYVIGDMDIHNLITTDLIEEYINIIYNASLVVMDGNIPKETMSYILKLCTEHNIPVWFEPTDLSIAFKPFECTDLWNSAIAYASPNLNELRVMHNTILGKDIPLSSGSKDHLNNILEEALYLGMPLLEGSFHTLVVTLGSHGVLVISNLHAESHFPLVNKSAAKGKVRAFYYSALTPKNVVSVSGAGDCFAAGMIGGILQGMDLNSCVRMGQRAAILSLSSHHAVPETLNPHDVFHTAETSSMREPLILA